MYKDLVGDSSAAATTSQSELDELVHAFFELEEPNLVYDLRQLYSGRESMYDTWEKAKEFLDEDVGTAVNDRCHSQAVHLAKAISVRDLPEQVIDRCPPDTPLPSEEYIRLQFLPRRKNTDCRVLHREARSEEDGATASVEKITRRQPLLCLHISIHEGVCIDDERCVCAGVRRRQASCKGW